MAVFSSRPKRAAPPAAELSREPPRDEPLSARAEVVERPTREGASRKSRFEAAHAWVLENHAKTFEKLAK